jgi:hypothetical protein
MRSNFFSCVQWRKVVAQIGMAQLHDPFRAGKTAKLVSAQIGQPHIGGQRVDN